MNVAAVYRKKGDTVTRHIAGETILVPIRNNLADMQGIFTLNPVAEYIWQQLDGQNNLAQIRDGITDSFEVDGPRAGEDMVEFIDQLLAQKIIEEM